VAPILKTIKILKVGVSFEDVIFSGLGSLLVDKLVLFESSSEVVLILPSFL